MARPYIDTISVVASPVWPSTEGSGELLCRHHPASNVASGRIRSHPSVVDWFLLGRPGCISEVAMLPLPLPYNLAVVSTYMRAYEVQAAILRLATAYFPDRKASSDLRRAVKQRRTEDKRTGSMLGGA